MAESQIQHKNEESREPTQDEMNLMVDEMRMRFRQTYGQDAYNSAVSEDERKKTAERMACRAEKDRWKRINTAATNDPAAAASPRTQEAQM